MDTKIREIEDRILIGEVLSGYCRMLDTMDLNQVGNLFTLDCVVEFGPDERLNARSAQALASNLSRLWRWRRTSHHLSNVEVAFRSDSEACASSYVIAWHERPDGTTATLYGTYRDTLVRTVDGWRISTRRQEMNGSDAGFTVGIFPASRAAPPAGWAPPNYVMS
ncbi:nuclear transport factor 2 family protein [Microvirga antarctica]|uniref:nuclear transport factor 2 family protein n=1 Tax=Microvirga antarctica TaxID=2819233 RepID=UPI001B3160A7|nr:nuclear transport factor 2 family protein [Microvirga antarctica]